MNEIERLKFDGIQIVLHIINGEIMLEGEKVAKALRYNEPLKALNDYVAEESKLENIITITPEEACRYTLINKAGIYSLIANANQSERRRKFKNWIEWEVFPAIRINNSAEEKMSKEDYIGLAWVRTGSSIVVNLCEFPPFELAIAKGVKVVVDGLNGQEIGKVMDCRTVAKDYDDYYANMIMNDVKPYGKIIGTVNEFNGA